LIFTALLLFFRVISELRVIRAYKCLVYQDFSKSRAWHRTYVRVIISTNERTV